MSEQDTRTTDILIVGGGLSGLMAAHVLTDAGLSVVLVEKADRVGGRLFTHRIGETSRADLGAQFFTARSPRFRAMVEEWLEKGFIFEWAQSWSDGSAAAPTGNPYPRYAAQDGMGTLARHLARGLDTRTVHPVAAVRTMNGGWRISFAGDRDDWQARGLLLTPPVPQTLALLDAGGVTLDPADREALEAIRYAPCVCGVFQVNGRTVLPNPGAVQKPNEPVGWIADNRRKGISPGETVVTVHASADFSRSLWEEEKQAIVDALTPYLVPYLATNARITEAEIKRWTYALPTQLYPERTLLAAGLPPLAFAGDAFNGPRVEGAALSGLAAAEALLEVLKR